MIAETNFFQVKKSRLCLRLILPILVFSALISGSLRNEFLNGLQRLPVLDVPADAGQMADALHAISYALFGFFLYFGYGFGRRPWIWAVVLAVMTEVLQCWVPDRTPSAMDALINVCGLFSGGTMGKLVLKYLEK